eukprot:14269560-Alexandrium_andersonii.AAC.1
MSGAGPLASVHASHVTERQCSAFLVLICCSGMLDVVVALVAHLGSSLVGARRAPRRAVSAR